MVRLLKWQMCAALLTVCCGQFAQGQQGANQGWLSANGKKVSFKHIVAVRGESYKEPRIIVLATGQKLGADAIASAIKKDAEENLDRELGQPYLKAVFLEDGELRCLIGRGADMSFFNRSKPLEGEAVIKDGRIQGEVKCVETGTFAKDMSLKFDVPMSGLADKAPPVKLDPPVKPSITGKFTGNGEPGNLKFVSVLETEPFNDKEAVQLLFTERDPSKSRNPSFDAGFGKLGNALILSVHWNGGIFGCEVWHAAHSKQGFTALGEISMTEFDLAGGNAVGHVTTGKELETFGQKWDVDLKFAAPLPEKLRAAMSRTKTAATDDQESRGKSKAAVKVPAGPRIEARKLPFPADARQVDFKPLVEQIRFESNLPVDKVAQEFSAKLRGQGWKDGKGSVVGKQNTILQRELGDATLTIFVSPTKTGSLVKMITSGLDWGTDDTAGKTVTADDDDDDDDIEMKAKSLIKKVLQDLDDDDEDDED